MSVKGKKTIWAAAVMVASIAPFTQPQFCGAKAIDLPYSVIGRYYQSAAGSVNQDIQAAFSVSACRGVTLIDVPSFRDTEPSISPLISGNALTLVSLTGGAITIPYRGATSVVAGTLHISGPGVILNGGAVLNASSAFTGAWRIDTGVLSINSGTLSLNSLGYQSGNLVLGSGSLYKTGAGILQLADASSGFYFDSGARLVNGTLESTGFSIDQVAAIPEPSAAVLPTLAGASALAIRRRRNLDSVHLD